uniref:GLOBIN domain-containing protein n=1 Tax=Parastrongyloides trichosuri TaxID=131310 RepID=A0A0N4ZQY5_PARTI
MKGSKLLCCCKSKKTPNQQSPSSPFENKKVKEPDPKENIIPETLKSNIPNGDGVKNLPPKLSNNSQNMDKRIPLTERQKFLLVKNWKGISRRARDAGANLFVQLLNEHEELFEYFKFGSTVKGKNKSEMMGDERLQNHGEAVMRILDSVITSVNDPEEMFKILEEQGRAHALKKNFKPELFREVEDALFYTIKLILDERYTDNMDNIYRVIMKTILKTLEDSCREEMIRLKTLSSQ